MNELVDAVAMAVVLVAVHGAHKVAMSRLARAVGTGRSESFAGLHAPEMPWRAAISGNAMRPGQTRVQSGTAADPEKLHDTGQTLT